MRILNGLIKAAAIIAAALVWVRGRRDPAGRVDPRRLHHDYPQWMD